MAMRYFSLDIDMGDDPKVTALVSARVDPTQCTMLDWNRSVSEVVGTLVRLWGEVYRQGYALDVNGVVRSGLAMRLGMTEGELCDFLRQACSVGLFDQELYDDKGLLISSRTVSNWLSMTKQSASSLGDEVPDRLRPSDAAGSSQCRQREAAAKNRKAPRGKAARGEQKTSEDSREVPKSSEDSREVPKTSEDSREVPKTPAKRKEIRLDEKKEDERESSSSSAIGIDGMPPCMAAERGDGTWFSDGADGMHPTIGEALEARYRQRTGLPDFGEFVAKVARLCPSGCRGDPDRARQCHALIATALEKYEPTLGTSPVPLTMKIIKEDRGF